MDDLEWGIRLILTGLCILGILFGLGVIGGMGVGIVSGSCDQNGTWDNPNSCYAQSKGQMQHLIDPYNH